MPTISMFYSILVPMYVFDTEKHHLPHIHIRYNEFQASIAVKLRVLCALRGEKPAKQNP